MKIGNGEGDIIMGFLKGGGGFDWNGNGKKDSFDRFMDMKVSGRSIPNHTQNSSSHKAFNDKEIKGISMGGKPLYDATQDSSGMTIFKCILVIALCIGGMILPGAADMGVIGTLLCIFGGVGVSVLVLKNV